MAAKSSFTRAEPGGRRGTDTSRVSSVSSQFSDGPQHSPSSHSSTPSWSEEPAQSNMDISTGHMILVHTHKLEFRLYFASVCNMPHLSMCYKSENHTLINYCTTVSDCSAHISKKGAVPACTNQVYI